MTQQNTEMGVQAMVEAGLVSHYTDELMGRLGPLLARPEPYRTCRDYHQWLGAMRRYRSDDREEWLQGGAYELSTVLQGEARTDPGRFLNLMREMPDDVHEAYPSAILIGVGDSVGAAEAEACTRRCDDSTICPAARAAAG